ncbi:hypothetical protein N7447_007929 [Penicillium robsamsonii]|uniref:uncharacterized protein n=1 Tax=Penicillium robsamsonii TaxID=1792511 RepID=UPI002548654D|nr:uncharacterized protein N7447_007929 [Penicillium robsamsonii]KAJ5817921.1 hypothetical protein N7447_007929 [Penicillium robsamsonii]
MNRTIHLVSFRNILSHPAHFAISIGNRPQTRDSDPRSPRDFSDWSSLFDQYRRLRGHSDDQRFSSQRQH